MLRQFYNPLLILIGSIFIAIGTNWFLIPSQLIGGGVTGLALIASYLFGWPVSWLFLMMNIPLLLWGLFSLGLGFIRLTILSVSSSTLFITLIPPTTSPFITTLDLPIAAIFGGLLIGIGVGLSLRVGGSSGGFDILGAILTHKYEIPIGQLLLGLNTLVLLCHGILNEWNAALWSMISIYASVRIIEYIHIKYAKVTAIIVTNQHQRMQESLLSLARGVTIFHTTGAFHQQPNKTFMTVTTRYELPYLKRKIAQIDAQAFVNIIETSDVMGSFRKSK